MGIDVVIDCAGLIVPGQRTSSALSALVARDHGADQILMMRKARENHRSDVRENECEGDVRQDHVRPLYGLAGLLTEHAGKRPRLMFPTINHTPPSQ